MVAMTEAKRLKTIYAIGECMVEFSRTGDANYRRSFAGDVYNTAVYLRRLAPADCNVEFVSAVGDDTMSAAMMSTWRQEGISTNFVAVIPGKSPGLYVIDTDEKGERGFSYWRSQSAARQLSVSLAGLHSELLRDGDYIYFSGITLAILSENDRVRLLDLVRMARSAGVIIAFDPNFRPALWASRSVAVEFISRAYGLADIVLTGAEEEEFLFRRGSQETPLDALERHGVVEAVLKAAEKGVFGVAKGVHFHLPFVPAENVVDTTAAGDSFAGAYLAFRLRGKPPAEAAGLAASVARIVVSARGAILDKEYLRAQMTSHTALKSALMNADGVWI
jgi:2-dehydro-3-deoxygluconokinase